MLSTADHAYVREQFVPLEDLCVATGRNVEDVRAEIAARRRPAPPYPGLEYVPANYFELPDAEEFRRTFDGPDLEAELESYLDGIYFVCVRDANVLNIRRKEELVTRIRSMLSELRAAIEELDRLERPFSPDFDRKRFGKLPTRDELIEPFKQLWA